MTRYEPIDDEAIDRIISLVDTSGDWYDIRKKLVKRFPKWTAHQRDRMATRIIERSIEKQQFEAGKITAKYTQMALKEATGPGGTSKARYKIVRTTDGKILGRPGNVRITTRKGNKVYAKNRLTGRKGRIK